jgi:hypothetical protein
MSTIDFKNESPVMTPNKQRWQGLFTPVGSSTVTASQDSSMSVSKIMILLPALFVNYCFFLFFFQRVDKLEYSKKGSSGETATEDELDKLLKEHLERIEALKKMQDERQKQKVSSDLFGLTGNTGVNRKPLPSSPKGEPRHFAVPFPSSSSSSSSSLTMVQENQPPFKLAKYTLHFSFSFFVFCFRFLICFVCRSVSFQSPKRSQLEMEKIDVLRELDELERLEKELQQEILDLEMEETTPK